MLKRLELSIYKFKKELSLRLRVKEKFMNTFKRFRFTQVGQVEFFFYSNSYEEAIELKNNISELLDDVDISESNDRWLIMGYKDHLDFESVKFDQLVEKLSELAFITNSKFDGWGSGVIQE